MDPGHQPAHSCKHCQRIVLRPENFERDVCRIKIPFTEPEIQRAVQDGCVWFRLFSVAYSGGPVLEGAIGRQISASARRLGTIIGKIGAVRALLEERPWPGNLYVVIANNEGRYNIPSGKVVYFQYGRTVIHSTCNSIRASPGIAAVQLANHLETAQYPFVGDKYSLRKACQWLTKCHARHTLCPGPTSHFVPTRLLKIEFDDMRISARLVDALIEPNPKWAALTYVWGGDQEFKATLSTLSMLRKKFDVQRLPSTIRDALTVCKGLELEYLWVDCLCIIQDDPADLARELAIMPQIYQQAWVTISASTAKSVQDGFLHDRGYKTLGDRTPISLPYTYKDGVNSGTIIIGEASRPSVADENDTMPIHHRAWTYQERRLSPRILDFTDRNLTFICRTGKRCQGSGSMLWTSPEAGLWKAQQHNIPCLFDQDLPTWHSVVVGYINRELTFPGDKLKAISALADVYRRSTKKSYVAGLWKESILHDLCWRFMTPRSLKTTDVLLHRPVDYRAPSWSWAAAIMSKRHEFEFFPSKYAGICEVKADAVVREVSLQQKPRNTTYGHISSGFIRVEGLVVTKAWHYNQASFELGNRLATTSRDALEHFWKKDLQAAAEVKALILIRGKLTNDQEEYFIFGLLLVLVDIEKGFYQRVGTFHSSVTGWELASEAQPQLDRGFQRITLTVI